MVIPFTREFSRTSSADFIRRDLVGKLGIEALVMGYNHHFGHNKEGDYGSLRSAERPELQLCRIGRFCVDGEKVSSTAVPHARRATAEVAHAARMLCHPYLLIAGCEQGRLHIDNPYKLRPLRANTRSRPTASLRDSTSPPRGRRCSTCRLPEKRV